MARLWRRRSRWSDPEAAGWTLTRERTAWLAAALVLVALPHLGRVPGWIGGLFLTLLLWRLAATWGAVRLPARWVAASVSLAVLPGVWLSYGTLLGRHAGVALLVVLAGMKLLETRTLRDAYVVAFLGLFLVIAGFLYSQSIPMGLWMVPAVAVVLAALNALGVPGGRAPPLARMRIASVLMLQALPLALVLFVLFPRVSGPLWGLPRDAHSAISGLGDTMAPGEISQLSLSDAVAFRVRFDGPVPPSSAQYWRGPVLWESDGRTWKAGRSARSSRPIYVEVDGDPVDYVVTLEPHQRHWLFALDLATTVPPGAVMTRDYQLHATETIRERRQYRVRSHIRYRMPRPRPEELEQGLALPFGHHPRSVALGKAWREELGGDREVVDHALAWLREQPFHYTLSPPRLADGDPIDRFLFETRRGFCEHYAAAFTVVMRAAGIPARVVTGYQGGELNPLGDYLVVRQRDAHAWVEVWLGQEGWVRVDPTAAVSPLRIERGLQASLPGLPGGGARGFGYAAAEPLERLWRSVRHGWDAVNTAWNEWVLSYGPSRQQIFLARLGLDLERLSTLVLALIGTLATLLLAVALWLAKPSRERDPALRCYRRFCARLARAGLPPRRPGEGPLDYARRAREARPELAERIDEVTRLYVEVRYAGAPLLPRLRRAVAGLRL